jgi:AcrR family transcriptional regulator
VTEGTRGARRREILVAAGQLLARYGFSKTTMDDVGRAVGLNKASLYYYFPNKEALVAAVIGREARLYLTELQASADQTAGCSERITCYIHERFRIFQKVFNLHKLSLQDFRQTIPSLRKEYAQCMADELAFLRAILDECVAKGELVPCDTERVARSILAVPEAFKSKVVMDPDALAGGPVDYGPIIEDVLFTVSLIVQGLQTK